MRRRDFLAALVSGTTAAYLGVQPKQIDTGRGHDRVVTRVIDRYGNVIDEWTDRSLSERVSFFFHAVKRASR